MSRNIIRWVELPTHIKTQKFLKEVFDKLCSKGLEMLLITRNKVDENDTVVM